MIPANFPFQNCVLSGGGDPDIQELPAYRHPDQGYILSCWKLDDVELESVRKSGVVWLYVWGGHPPVSVSGVSPFREVVLQPATSSRETLLELATWHAEQAHALHQLLENSQTVEENGGRPERVVDEDGFARARRIVAQGGIFAPWLEKNYAPSRHQLSEPSEGEGLRREGEARAEVDSAETGRHADPDPQDASGTG